MCVCFGSVSAVSVSDHPLSVHTAVPSCTTADAAVAVVGVAGGAGVAVVAAVRFADEPPALHVSFTSSSPGCCAD